MDVLYGNTGWCLTLIILSQQFQKWDFNSMAGNITNIILKSLITGKFNDNKVEPHSTWKLKESDSTRLFTYPPPSHKRLYSKKNRFRRKIGFEDWETTYLDFHLASIQFLFYIGSRLSVESVREEQRRELPSSDRFAHSQKKYTFPN